LGKYKDGLNISTLKERKEKLIYFTSLFGTGKFSIKDPDHQQFFNTLQQTMIYKHPAVLRMSEIVVHALGVEFVGVHLRYIRNFTYLLLMDIIEQEMVYL
jgi:hypothetical protein